MSAARIKLPEAALKLFVPPPGAKAPRRKRPEPTLLPPGTIVAEFVVDGDAVPWRAPHVMRGIARTPAHVKAWKEKVATAAHGAGYGQGRGAEPYAGPVRVVLLFVKACKVKRRRGTRWATRPDVDNLCKGFVDALTGNVFKVPPKRKKGEPKVRTLNLPPSPIGRVLADDNLCVELRASKWYGPASWVWVTIEAVAPDPPGMREILEGYHGQRRT
jgi:Holliday junction resolvase RusA-like endonuclease